MTTKQCKCATQTQGNFCSNCGAALMPDLFQLTKEGKFEDLEKALKEYTYDLNAQDENGYTVLTWATSKGKTECVKLLLEKGADPTITDDEDETALHCAARRGSKECIELLLKHGADPNITNDEDDTALTIAAEFGYKDCLKLLLERGAIVTIELKEEYPQYADLWRRVELLKQLEILKRCVAAIEEQLEQ